MIGQKLQEALKSKNKLYEKEGLATSVDNGEYKVIKDDFVKAEIKSKLKGIFYTNNEGKVYYEDTKAGKPEEDIKEEECPAITCNYKLIDIPEEFIEKMEEQERELSSWGKKTEYGILTYNAYELFNGKQIFGIFYDGEIFEIIDIQKFIETGNIDEARIEENIESPNCFQEVNENGKLVGCPIDEISSEICKIISDKNLTFLSFGQMEKNFPTITDINGKTWILETIGYDDYKLMEYGYDADNDYYGYIESDLFDIEISDYKSISVGRSYNYIGLKNDNSLWEFGFMEDGVEEREILKNVKHAFYKDKLYILESGDLYYYYYYYYYDYHEEPEKIMENVKDVHILDNARNFDSFFITKLNGDVFGWGDYNSWLSRKDKKFREPTKVNLDIKKLLGRTYEHVFYLTNSNEIKYWDGNIDNDGVLLVGDVKEFGGIDVIYNSLGSDNKFNIYILNSKDELWEIKLIENYKGDITDVIKTKISENVSSILFSNSTSYINKRKSYITKDNKVYYTDYNYEWREIDNVSEVLYDDAKIFIFKYLNGAIGYINKYIPDEITPIDSATVLRTDYNNDNGKVILSVDDNVIVYPNYHSDFMYLKFSYGKIKDVAITNNDRLFVLNENNELYELKDEIWVKIGSINSCIDYIVYIIPSS